MIEYKFMDEKLGLGPGGGVQLPVKEWKAANPNPAVGDIEKCGGFLFRCSVSGARGAIGPSPQYLTDGGVTWVLVGPASAITGADAAPTCEVGYIALAKDVGSGDYGVGEFQYVKFTGNVNPGDFVALDRGGKTCAGLTNASAKGSVGIAMCTAANGQYGWVMIRGVHDAANVVTGVAAGTALGAGGAAGRAIATAAGVKLDGAFERVGASANNVGTVEMEWPAFTGNG